MDRDDYAVTKRFIDLSNQADRKGIVLFSDFLNMNEINLLYKCKDAMPSTIALYGGYDEAERQMAAFQPDALYYSWEFPIACICFTPVRQKFAEDLSHRDVLGSLMHLGIERSTIGDILLQDDKVYIFCEDKIKDFILQELYKIRHTQVLGKTVNMTDFVVKHHYVEQHGVISSNRLDAFVSLACKLSRAKASEYILGENLFINGKLISNHNQKLSPGDIVSMRSFGKIRIDEIGDETKKGRIKVSFRWYQ